MNKTTLAAAIALAVLTGCSDNDTTTAEPDITINDPEDSESDIAAPGTTKDSEIATAPTTTLPPTTTTAPTTTTTSTLPPPTTTAANNITEPGTTIRDTEDSQIATPPTTTTAPPPTTTTTTTVPPTTTVAPTTTTVPPPTTTTTTTVPPTTTVAPTTTTVPAGPAGPPYDPDSPNDIPVSYFFPEGLPQPTVIPDSEVLEIVEDLQEEFALIGINPSIVSPEDLRFTCDTIVSGDTVRDHWQYVLRGSHRKYKEPYHDCEWAAKWVEDGCRVVIMGPEFDRLSEIAPNISLGHDRHHEFPPAQTAEYEVINMLGTLGSQRCAHLS